MCSDIHTNIIGDPFNAEPYDKRHEEYNKRGLNLFNVKTVEDFEKAFLLVDEFSNIPNYEPMIEKMRTCMRSYTWRKKIHWNL